MKIYCEYCGAQFDIETNHECPECGAAFDKNKYAFELQEQKRRERYLKHATDKAELEKKRAEIEHKKAETAHTKAQTQYTHNRTQMEKNANKAAKIIALIIGSPFILFAGLLGITMLLGIIMGIYTVITGDDEWLKDETEIVEVVDKEPKFNFFESSGGFNESISNGTLSVTIDEVTEVDPYPFTADKDHMYILVHFIVENVSEWDFKDEEKVRCTANGILMEKKWVNDYKELKETTIPSGMKIDGYLSFQVPIAAKELEITYGDYITINIPNAVKN